MNTTEDSNAKLSTSATARRFGVSNRSIDRWLANGIFPKPIRINGRKYWAVRDLEQFERKHGNEAQAPLIAGSH
jgi:DNA-binding transcriptional MerR regulator